MEGRLLHVGCGSGHLPEWTRGVQETRLDVDPAVGPDIVANMTDMGDIGEFDIVFCQHALEHLPPHEVGQALSEFHRVLKPGGHVIVFVPDLEGVQATDEVLFDSPAGPISGLDLLYGFRPALEAQPHMAHRTGFVVATLVDALENAGFSSVAGKRLPHYNMMGAAIK
jgi:protein O-GlcNAc transferase